MQLTTAGRAGVPGDAVAVVLNVTVTEAQGDGFITVFPCGSSRPTPWNLNSVADTTIGSPTQNATTHVVAVPMHGCPAPDQPGVALFNGTTGALLRTITITTTVKVCSQPGFANGKLFVADNSGRLTAYGP